MEYPIILDVDATEEYELGVASQTFVNKIEGEPYSGPTTIMPKLDTIQVLETTGCIMRDDVTVYEIPITYTTNPHGGKTVLIG